MGDTETKAPLYRGSAALNSLLCGRWERVDDGVPAILAVLQDRLAALYWHKHGTFEEHLRGVAQILYLWSQEPHVARCGLIHSAYSNSYVNLCLFEPSQERAGIQQLVGERAEELTYKFCTINRHELIFERCLPLAKAGGSIPLEGFQMENIKQQGEIISLSALEVKEMVILTMADFAEQLFGWQEVLFAGDGFMEGAHGASRDVLWPGDGKPGIWMNFVSLLGRLVVKESDDTGSGDAVDSGAHVEVPVFNRCSVVLDLDAEKEALEAYWGVAMDVEASDAVREERLRRCISLNPFIGEPRVLLAQVLNKNGRYEEGLHEAREALRLFTEWGTAWDKRVSFGGWVAMCRIQVRLASEETYPRTPLDFLNMGKLEISTNI